jgi:hypothetical protein
VKPTDTQPVKTLPEFLETGNSLPYSHKPVPRPFIEPNGMSWLLETSSLLLPFDTTPSYKAYISLKTNRQARINTLLKKFRFLTPNLEGHREIISMYNVRNVFQYK